jgi:hypothetical protein
MSANHLACEGLVPATTARVATTLSRMHRSRLDRVFRAMILRNGNRWVWCGMADLIERKSLKLLVQAGQTLNRIVSEGLCDEPQKPLMRAMLEEMRGMLDEFEQAYFDD